MTAPRSPTPADESVLGTVPRARLATPPRRPKRAEIILKAARLLRERVEELAVTMTLEQGKPLAQSRLEVIRATEIIEWDATEGRRVYGRIIPTAPGMRHSVLRQPIGIVAGFSP